MRNGRARLTDRGEFQVSLWWRVSKAQRVQLQKGGVCVQMSAHCARNGTGQSPYFEIFI